MFNLACPASGVGWFDADGEPLPLSERAGDPAVHDEAAVDDEAAAAP